MRAADCICLFSSIQTKKKVNHHVTCNIKKKNFSFKLIIKIKELKKEKQNIKLCEKSLTLKKNRELIYVINEFLFYSLFVHICEFTIHVGKSINI